MRVSSERPVESGGWIHRLTGALPVIQVDKWKPRDLPDFTGWARNYARNPKAKEARRKLARMLCVSVSVLERLGVGYGQDDYGGRSEFWAFPEFDHNHRVVGVVRRFFPGQEHVDEHGDKVGKKTMYGSAHGLYFQRDWSRGEGPYFITEGGSDTASMLSHGLRAIGRPSCTGGGVHLCQLLFRGVGNVVVLAERDRKPERVGGVESCAATCPGCAWCWPGKYGAVAIARRVASTVGAEHVKVQFPPSPYKDVREYFTFHRDGARGYLTRAASAEEVDWRGYPVR